MSTEPKDAAPMPALVERLLTATGRVGETAWCAEAADRIASLEAEVAALRGFIATYAYHWLYCMHSALEAKCTCGYDKALAAIDSAIAAKGK